MTSTQGLSEKQPETAPAAALSWRVHVLRERPIRSTIAILLVAGFCAVVLLTYEPVFFAISVAFFLVSLASFFFPTTYTLTPEGPSRRILGMETARRWSEFRSFAAGRDGARLYTSRRRSRLGNLRGFSLRFAGNRAAVLDYLGRHLSDARAPETAGARASRSATPSEAPTRTPGPGPAAFPGRP